MIVTANIPCRNGSADDPSGLALHPRYVAEGAVWYGSIAREFASMGCDIQAMLPMGSPRFQRMASNLNAMDGPLACAMGLVNHRLQADFQCKVWAYIGWALDRSPEDVAMPAWDYPRRISWAEREQVSDQIERADRFGWTGLVLDAISGQHNHDGKALDWMDFVSERSKCAVGGEAFLRGEPGMTGSQWEQAAWRHDLMDGRMFCALLGPWIEKYGLVLLPEHRGNKWAWLNGHTRLAHWPATGGEDWAEWWSPRGADELLERVAAAGFERVIIDVDKVTPETVAFVRRFLDA